jgi:hypothetical protein
MRTLILMHKNCAVIQDKVMSIGRSTTAFDIKSGMLQYFDTWLSSNTEDVLFCRGKERKNKNKQSTLSKNLIISGVRSKTKGQEPYHYHQAILLDAQVNNTRQIKLRKESRVSPPQASSPLGIPLQITRIAGKKRKKKKQQQQEQQNRSTEHQNSAKRRILSPDSHASSNVRSTTNKGGGSTYKASGVSVP